MPLVSWASLDIQPTDPDLTAVEALQAQELRSTQYLEQLAARVHPLIRRASLERARESIRVLMPHDHDFLSRPSNQWAAYLLEAGELVRTRLAEQNLAWPQPVKGRTPRRRSRWSR